MATPRVSVVLPTRNRAEMLSHALTSALDQREVEVEVIVVDEGSSDDTGAVLEAVADSRLSAIRHDQPKGVARARNAAIDRATGEWVAFLDDDDILAPENFRTQLAAAEDAVMSYSARFEIDSNMSVMHVSRPGESSDLGRRLLVNNTIGGPSGVLVRKEALDAAGRFDEDLSALADWDLWIRLAAIGTARLEPTPLIAYRHHPENMMVTDADRLLAEFDVLRKKHEAAAESAGIQFGSSWLGRWQAGRELAQGHRVKAALRYAQRAVADRSPRDLVRAATALGGARLQRLGRAAEARGSRRPEWLERHA